ncbi:BOI-related E3 ubiquitin-protein ligase 1-like isoform X1 [Neltuma alba]|uniref:BOI-related E3 ubiquitin-protein ligase 1-like isoform X1 n=1 Tax=Neltuma alba TaxID=207710 RepID=UPI0010A33BD9|nr:BOI-related E3 ubiquitin-protein ligase 1-like isoform X1 [Prosopis alba]
MAVQAQYPSNILLLHNHNNNTSNLQPDYDSSFPPAEALLHQSHMLFANGAGSTNPSKRSSQSRPPIAVAQAVPNVVNSMSLQSPQLLELSQHHNHHHNSVSTGLRLSSFADQQPLHLLPHQQQQSSQDASHYSPVSPLFSQDFASQIKQHRDEIDQFLRAQEAELHRTLAEKRQRHYRVLLATAEETVARRLREKDLEVEKVTRMNAQLEARAAQLSAEAQLWQAKAKAQEATAASLQAQLQQAMMNGTASEKRDEGGLSCAAGADDAESVYVDPDRFEPTGPKCRGCGKRVASVVVLPCRHLCMCAKCDVHFRACPVCLSLKESTVEVFLT